VNMLYSYLPFMLFAFVASITPGPTNILILASSQRYGIRATLPAVFGACVQQALLCLSPGRGQERYCEGIRCYVRG
jgi:threonine/homoserine/homoserine lactone efflux protein